ncbi:MAG: hypothetical protein M0Z95_25430 [Actinomycetota bacterium]|nr:hypothetical protein [Actinomycetota bacterium]
MANLDSIESVAVNVLPERIGCLAYIRIWQLREALEVATDCDR